jgi:hypothetical protein
MFLGSGHTLAGLAAPAASALLPASVLHKMTDPEFIKKVSTARNAVKLKNKGLFIQTATALVDYLDNEKERTRSPQEGQTSLQQFQQSIGQ